MTLIVNDSSLASNGILADLLRVNDVSDCPSSMSWTLNVCVDFAVIYTVVYLYAGSRRYYLLMNHDHVPVDVDFLQARNIGG